MKLYTYSEAQHKKRSPANLKIIGNLSLAVNYGDLEMLPHIYVTYVYSPIHYLATFLSRIFHEIGIDQNSYLYN